MHLIESVDSGRGFLGYTLDVRQTRGIPSRIGGQSSPDRREQNALFLACRVIQHGKVRFGTAAQMQQQGGIATIIQDHVGMAAIRPFEDAMGERPVFFQTFALIGEDRSPGRRDGGCGVILCREDVA